MDYQEDQKEDSPNEVNLEAAIEPKPMTCFWMKPETFIQVMIVIFSALIAILLPLSCDCFTSGVDIPGADDGQYSRLTCFFVYHFEILAIAAFIFPLFFLFSTIHMRSAYPVFPWIFTETVFYFIWAIQYFLVPLFISIIVVWTIVGFQMVIAFILGVVSCILLVGMAFFKFTKFEVQKPSDVVELEPDSDPDGNAIRQVDPNLYYRLADSEVFSTFTKNIHTKDTAVIKENIRKLLQEEELRDKKEI